MRQRGGGGVRACARAREAGAGGGGRRRARSTAGRREEGRARESSACGNGDGDGDGVRRRRAVTATACGGSKIRQHLPCFLCLLRASDVFGKGEGAAVYRRRVIGPGPWQRPGPLTHCSRAGGTPGTYEAQVFRQFPPLPREHSLVPGISLARDQ